MKRDYFDSLLPVATTYANQLTATFNLFLTVIFGSLAFAAALPLGKVGPPLFGMQISASSVLMATVLLSFYLISFISFLKMEKHLNTALIELCDQVAGWEVRQATLAVLKPSKNFILGLSLPSFGYVIGSLGSLAIFIWVSNAERIA